MDLPCTQCAKKGLACGKADKVWGSKRQLRESEKILPTAIDEFEQPYVDLIGYIVPPPLEERLSVLEESCISYYFRASDHFWSYPLRDHLARRFGYKVASKTVRSMIVASSIDLFRSQGICVDRCQELDYLGQFYYYMQIAIQEKRFSDLVYAGIIHCDYLDRHATPVEEVANHATGLLLGLSQMQETEVMLGRYERSTLRAASNIVASSLLLSAYRRKKNALNASLVLGTLNTLLSLGINAFELLPFSLRTLLTIVFENLEFRSSTTVKNSNLDFVGQTYLLLRELYKHVRSNSWSWKMVHEQEFCNPKSPGFFSVPFSICDLDGLMTILWHSKLRFLNVIFELRSSQIEWFGKNDIETALLVCRLWPYTKVDDYRKYHFTPVAQHSLFLAGLILAKGPFLEGARFVNDQS